MTSSNVVLMLPIILTLVMAFTFRKTLWALAAGVISGAFILSQYSVPTTLVYIVKTGQSQFYANDQWQLWHINVLIAMLLLGSLTQLLARGGAVAQFSDWLTLRLHSPRQARLGVVLLGFVVFIDGIFSCLSVGHVCRPLQTSYGISRTQLAYFVDSTASPLCSLLPFSSWGPYVMAILAGLTLLNESPVSAFIEIAQLNFYAVAVLLLAIWVAWSGVGFKLDTVASIEPEATTKAVGDPWLLALPMLSLLILSMLLTLISGAQASTSHSVIQWLAKADIGAAMRNACLLSLALSCWLFWRSGRTCLQLLIDLCHGIKSMLFAMAILVFTWLIGQVIKDLQIASMLAGLAEIYLSPKFLVAGLFILCAVMAFGTGSSWGTFAIMLPIGAQIAHTLDSSLLLVTLSAVMAGSVFGDHCSPISDTSVLSATSSGCDPYQHVVTQLPFALIAASASVIGFQLINLQVNTWLVWLIVLLFLVVAMLLMKLREGKKYIAVH